MYTHIYIGLPIINGWGGKAGGRGAGLAVWAHWLARVARGAGGQGWGRSPGLRALARGRGELGWRVWWTGGQGWGAVRGPWR